MNLFSLETNRKQNKQQGITALLAPFHLRHTKKIIHDIQIDECLRSINAWFSVHCSPLHMLRRKTWNAKNVRYEGKERNERNERRKMSMRTWLDELKYAQFDIFSIISNKVWIIMVWCIKCVKVFMCRQIVATK